MSDAVGQRAICSGAEPFHERREAYKAGQVAGRKCMGRCSGVAVFARKCGGVGYEKIPVGKTCGNKGRR